VNRILIAAVLAATAATPALAQETAEVQANSFTGFRVGGDVGIADEDILGTEAFTYGAEVGYDFDLGGAVAGVSAGIQDSTDTGRELSVGGRLGAKVSSNALVYGSAAYSNLKAAGFKLDGVRFGVGVEVVPTEHFFVKAEQRYANYELGAELWQTTIGFGWRF
jgi:outer membrane immunogenic protein